MGFSSYSDSSRTLRATTLGYTTKGRDEIFTQQSKRMIHEGMNPRDILFREACDSKEHPNVVPIQLFLDVTGSMGHIPHELIKEGLPKLISKLVQNGVPDVALMFGAIGDHECDRFPLQVAQFESGDAELDMWLTRTYLEGGGGGNRGESYPLAWYFAANHTRTDSFDKRGKKGFVFTVGDEPFLPNIPKTAIKELMGNTSQAQGTLNATDLYHQACEKNNVFHIFIEHGSRMCDNGWKKLMGQNCIVIQDHTKLPDTISQIVLDNVDQSVVSYEPSTTVENVERVTVTPKVEEIIL